MLFVVKQSVKCKKQLKILERNVILKYLIIPPVTKKYENSTNENTVIADGMCSHVGCFIFKLGTSSSKNGIL